MKRNKDVLFLTTSYPFSLSPSSGIFVKRLVDALAPKNRSITVVAPNGRGGTTLHGNAAVVGFKYLPARYMQRIHSGGGIPVAVKQNPLFVLAIPLLAVSMLACALGRGGRADVIVANWALSGCVGGMAGRLLGRPVITVFRGSDVNSKAKLQKLLVWGALRLSSRSVCVSENMADELRERYPAVASRIVHISNGLDPELLRMAPRALFPPFSVVLVANLTPNKNVGTVLEAVSVLQSQGMAISVDIIGSGPLRYALQAYVQEQGMRQVNFHGAVTPDVVYKLLGDSQVFILSSLSEGRSNALLEALASGCVVVASDIPANRELIAESRAGILFDPTQVRDLVDKLRNVFAAPEEAFELAARGQEWARTAVGSWDDCAETYQRLIEEIDG